MKKYIILFAIGLAIPAVGQIQLYQENVFGLNIPVSRWGINADNLYFGAPQTGYMGLPSDAANLRLISTSDTTDIILTLDKLTGQIRWLRCQANVSQRPIQYSSYYGSIGDTVGQFMSPRSIAVASDSPYYNPSTDHIYIADRTNHRIVSLNFLFHESDPESDTLIWESVATIDTAFSPLSLAYVVYPPDTYPNKLIALDDMGQRLAFYSHNGEFIGQIDLNDPSDSTSHIYSALTYKINSDTSVSLFLSDQAQGSIRQYILTSFNELQFVRELSIAADYGFLLTDLTYSSAFGLCAIDPLGPHIYQIDDSLSSVTGELDADDFCDIALYHPYKMIFFPDRLVVFERADDETGIITFAFNQPLGKRDNGASSVLPRKLTLNQNYPNPFNPATIIAYDLPEATHVILKIYDILGRKVSTLVDEDQPAGSHQVVWDASDRASGIYFYRLQAAGASRTEKCVLLK